MDQSNEWDIGKLQEWFDNKTIELILSNHVRSTDDGDDESTWCMTKKNGEYSVKSGYWYAKKELHSDNPNSTFWKKLWKQKLWPKREFFYWKLFHDVQV